MLLLAGGRAALWGQIAPGPLSRAHAQLSGLTHCTDCHKTTKNEFACLDCHKEIAARLRAGRGFHAAVVNGAVAPRECQRCHVEHKGADAALVKNAAPATFDHSKTGYPLEGKHAALACHRCHNPEHLAATDTSEIKVKDLKRTFLGLRRQCLSCHADQHRGQFKKDCLECHAYGEWKNPPRFKHDQTRFRRTGAHDKVACQKCHKPAANGAIQYVGLTYARCNDCHRDQHRAAFPRPCEACHSVGGWKQVDLGDKFTHARTQFPLRGKHSEVDCLKCHAEGDFKRQIAFGNCTDCHKPDPHSGQFAKRADRGECSACHTVEGFKAPRFAASEHSRTAFPLEGKHSAVACAKCHAPAGKATLFRLKYASCTDCHKDSHQAQFRGAPHFNRCEECHTAQGFRPATFTVARHQATRFPLPGAHTKLDCGKCHKADAGRPKSEIRFTFDDRSCTACHDDPHRGQFRQLLTQVRSDGSLAGCETCHTTESWKIVRFAHAVDAFGLVGAHRNAECAKCHKPATPQMRLADVDFRAAPTHCDKCHREPHMGEFARQDGSTLCADCHTPVHWSPAQFDHDRRTRFPLPGKHRGVKCAACHKNVRLIEGKAVTVFKATPRECAGCHRKPV